MTNTIDLKRIFRENWGYEPAQFNLPAIKTEDNTIPHAHGKNTYFMPVTLNEIELPNPVIKITGKKTIVETALASRQGTVKELINTEDFKINIKGIILLDDYNAMKNMIRQLSDLYQLEETLQIECELISDVIGDGSAAGVVITDISFPETVGTENVKLYEINLIGDKPFLLNQSINV